ncbi:MAG: class I SAM-dependent methyltransferase, partial [Clostridia bacterium]|nr:class I SAM-dependent methyltransferase [Clostridia bacterium]
FNFIQNAEKEMAENFKDVRVVDVDLRASWYICTPGK